MSYWHYKIRSLRLPRAVLYVCAGVLFALGALIGIVSVNSSPMKESQTLSLSAELQDYSISNFRSGRLYSYKFDGYCAEFISIDLSSFDSESFNRIPPVGETLQFRVRVSDANAVEDCARCEILELKNADATYFSLAQWNREVMGIRRTVSATIATLLGLVTLTLLWLASVSPRKDEVVETWERFRVS